MKTNRFINIKVALFIAVSAFMAACTIEDADTSVEPKAEKLSVEESVQMTATQTDQAVSVKSDVGWDVSIEGGWSGLTVSPMSGTGDGQITIHTDANTTRQSREATVSITTKGGVNQKFVINQALSDVLLDIDGISSLDFEASPEESKTFSFTCNTTWQITTSESWIRCDKTQGGEAISTKVGSTISVIADEIQTDVPRTGVIVISAENGAKTQQISVSQEGKKIELSVSPSAFEVFATGEQKIVQINCNADWTLKYDNGILLCDTTAGTGSRDIIVTCLPNKSINPRSATMTITSGIQDIKTQTVTFTQSAATVPELTAFSLVDGSVTKNEAEFVLDFTTMFSIDDYGIQIWEEGYESSTKKTLQAQNSESGINELKFKATGLKSMTTYQVTGFVKNDVGTATSTNTITFTTGGVKPSGDDNPTPALSRKKK